jgi:alpha-L-fucosidase 2
MPKETSVPADADYCRGLDLATATHTITYKSGGVTYRREAFASHPADVIVLRFSTDRPGACTGTVALRGTHSETTQAAGNQLRFSGALSNGLKYETQVVVLNAGGALQERDGNIEFAGCDSVTLLVADGTDYVMDYAKKFRGVDPHQKLAGQLQAASARSFDELKAAHVADFQALFNRVSLDFGATPADRLALPIDQRKVQHAEQGGDPDLEELLFQYGRYLMISCSRPGHLPANLQGLWCDSNNPPWHSDYHANINVQMNYWPAEPANLAECHTTLLDLIASFTHGGKRRRRRNGLRPPTASRAAGRCARRTAFTATWAGSGTCRPTPGIASISGCTTPLEATRCGLSAWRIP